MKIEHLKEGMFLKPNKTGIRNRVDPSFIFCILKVHRKGEKYFTAKYWDSRNGGKIVEHGGFEPKFYDILS